MIKSVLASSLRHICDLDMVFPWDFTVGIITVWQEQQTNYVLIFSVFDKVKKKVTKKIYLKLL